MGKRMARIKKIGKQEDVDAVPVAEEAEEWGESSTGDSEEMLSPVEDYSTLRADEISESICEIRRKAESNGGYVTYEELNRMLPQGVVDAIQSERYLKVLDALDIRLLREDEVERWQTEKEGRRVEECAANEDPVRMYMRQMGRVEMLTPAEEAAAFATVAAAERKCSELFNRYGFATKMYQKVLDQVENQSVRFDHVVLDKFEGDRDAYLALIPEFRRELCRARSGAAASRCFERMCFSQKTLETLCEEALEARKLSRRQHRELWLALKAARDARARIVEANLRLVVSIVKMVMRIEGCGREEAVRIIVERSAELRAKENARRNAHDLDFTK